MMHKEFKVKKEDFKSEQQLSVLERYGGEEHLDAPPKELLLAQTEHYVEYSRLGNVTKGQERAVAKSKYEEDVYVNNHTVSAIQLLLISSTCSALPLAYYQTGLATYDYLDS